MIIFDDTQLGNEFGLRRSIACILYKLFLYINFML